MPALALAFHLADGHHGPVGFASTLRALHWSVYLQTHARRCYGVAQSGEVDTARRILERVRKGDLLREGFGTRDIQRAGWSGLSNPKQVQEALVDVVSRGTGSNASRSRAAAATASAPSARNLISS